MQQALVCGRPMAAQAAFLPAKLSKRRVPSQRAAVRCQAQAVSTEQLFQDLAFTTTEYGRAPPSLKTEASGEVLASVQKLVDAGVLKSFGAALAELPPRRNVMLGELRMVGVKDPEAVGKPSVRNDAVFLMTVVGSTSLLAVVLGQLPGDWGFFSSYLAGGISLAVLAVGSINPGILQAGIDQFSKVFPDYRERVVRHEAAHFLLGYLLGVPVCSYSLSLGKEHTDFAEAKLQKRLIEQRLSAQEVDALSIVALAGATAEAQQYEEVIGQTADLSLVQRIMLRSEDKMTNAAQQNQTRWACYQAASLLRKYSKEYEALQQAMARGAGVADCIRAIEGC